MILRKIIKTILGNSYNRSPKLKIVVVANCQAHPLAHILSILNPDIEIIAVAVVHLLKSEQVDSYTPHFEEADFIITQIIGKEYPCDFVRTDILKQLYGNKLISILNLYYRGYNPEIIYIPTKSINGSFASGYLKGPLGDYHNKTFLDSWKEGVSVKEALNRHLDFEFNKELYSDLINSTMEELEMREKFVDVQITDFIKNNLDNDRLFFTINHPSKSLLVQMAARILRKAELKVSPLKNTSKLKESLDNIIIPINVFSKSKLNICFEDLNYFKGKKYHIGQDGGIHLGEQHNYNKEDLVKEFYNIYDNFIN